MLEELSKMKMEKSCGAIVFRKFHGNAEVLIVKHTHGNHWSFPKGHMEKDETEVQTALREVKEETGLDINIDDSFRESITYYPCHDIKKEVIFFLAKAKNYDFTPQPEEISQIRWMQLEHAYRLLTHSKSKSLLKKARPYMKSRI